MSTELERLKAWMSENDMTAAKLADALHVNREIVWNALADRRPISAKIKLHFLYKYGEKLAFEIFEIRRQPTHKLALQNTHPEKYAAHQALAGAVRRGEMPPAKQFKCHCCDKQATQYHHPSYRAEDRLNVIPLCKSCHNKADRGTLDTSLGVVPTGVGVIRIAIAGL